MDSTTLIEYIILGCAIFAFVIFWYLRFTGLYKLRIKKDFRNPARPPRTVFGAFNKNTNLITIYTRLLSPFSADVTPYFEPEAFADKKVIDCYQGITGQPGDYGIVPVGQTLMSRAQCESYATRLSDSVINALSKGYQQTQKKTVQVQMTDDKGAPMVDSAGRPIYKNIEQDENVNVPGIDLDENKVSIIKNIITGNWILHTMGVTGVKDMNLFLQHHKTQIAAARSITARYRSNNLSWFAQNQILVGFMIIAIACAISATILYQGISQDLSQYFATTAAQNQNLSPTIQALAHYFGLHQGAGTQVAGVNASNGTQAVS